MLWIKSSRKGYSKFFELNRKNKKLTIRGDGINYVLFYVKSDVVFAIELILLQGKLVKFTKFGQMRKYQF